MHHAELPPTTPSALREWLGDIDIYLLDQILRNRVAPSMRILDAGAGSGRNLVFLLRCGCDVWAVDTSTEAIDRLRRLASDLAPHLSGDQFLVRDITALPFAPGYFDLVICNAVLHFADSEEHFQRMVHELWRVIRPSGLLFTRLASSIGIEDRIQPVTGRRYTLPDGTERFLVDEAMLVQLTRELGGVLVDPIKTANVQGQRCMTTWCVRKHAATQPSA